MGRATTAPTLTGQVRALRAQIDAFEARRPRKSNPGREKKILKFLAKFPKAARACARNAIPLTPPVGLLIFSAPGAYT